MSMTSDILAIGPFDSSLIEYYEYPNDFYKETKNGVRIIEYVLGGSGTTHSRQLADCFGVDPYDFNQHELNPHTVNLKKLKEIVEPQEFEAFIAFRDAGYSFHFMLGA